MSMAAPLWMPPGVVGWPHNGLSGGIHTRLLGFVKTALMRQLVPSNSLVCDLFCGRGLDTERWAEAGIGRYIGVDLSASALEEAQEQWEQRDRPFPAEFCKLDPCMVDLEAHLQDHGLPADIVSCLAHLQDSFTSEEMVKRLLKNVEAVLKPGGFFFGTAPDSSTIWYKYQKAVQEAMKAGSLRMNGTLPAVRTDTYKITFDDDRFLPFGSKYHMRFTDDGLPSQPQLLVHFPSLIRLAKEVGLECVEIQNLMEFYDDYSGPFSDVMRNCCGSLMDLKGAPVLDAKGRLNGHAMDVLSLYTTFIFKKGDSTMPSSVEPAFKASNCTATYLTNFPRQNSEKNSYSLDEEVRKGEQEPAKSDEHVPVIPNSNTPSAVQNEEPQHDSYRYNTDTHLGESGEHLSASRPHLETWPEREEEVSEVMHGASPGQNMNQNTGLLDNHTEGQSHEAIEEPSTKRHIRGPRKCSFDPKRTSERVDESSRGDEQQQEQDIPPADRGPKHYTRRGHEKSGRGENHQELLHGDHTSKHYLRKACENQEDGNRLEKQQDQQRADHHFKRTVDGLDQSITHDKKESSPKDLTRHYERRTHDNLDDTSRNTKLQEPLAMDSSSKHYTRRTSDSSNERHRSESTFDKGRPQSGKWADRSGSQQESIDVQSMQGGRISRVVVKEFPASGDKHNARTAYVEEDARSPHLRNK